MVNIKFEQKINIFSKIQENILHEFEYYNEDFEKNFKLILKQQFKEWLKKN